MENVSHTAPYKLLGFTLLELLVVLALLSLVASIATPNMVSFYHSSKQGALTREVVFKLGKARTAAIETGTPVDFIFSYEEQSFGVKSSIQKVPSGFVLDMISAQEIAVDHGWFAIRFYPDGSSTGGTVDIISHQTQVVIHVRIDWLLGYIELWKEAPDGTK